MIWKQFAVSIEQVLMVVGFADKFVSLIDKSCLLPLSLDDSVHSNDSLSESSPPASSAQGIQTVQNTTQVRGTNLHI